MNQEAKPFELGPLQKKWIAFLRENADLQQKNSLGRFFTKTDGTQIMKYCCLGAARKLICEAEGTELTIGTATLDSSDKLQMLLDIGENFDYDRAGGILVYSYEKIGLHDSLARLLKPAEIVETVNDMTFHKTYFSLVGMNDGHRTWPQIADYIEQNPENVFTKSV